MILLPKLISYCDEKINIFKEHKMWDASMSEIVGVLSDHNFVITEKDCGGYWDRWNKEIAVSFEWWDAFAIGSLFHELGHAFKAELEVYEKEQILISWKLRDEIETDRIAKYMLDRLYPNLVPDTDILTYQWNDADAKFLADWYGDWVENDIKNFGR